MYFMERAEKAVSHLQSEFKEVFTASDYRTILGHEDYLRLRKTLADQIHLLDTSEASRLIVEQQRQGLLPGGATWDERADPIIKQTYEALLLWLKVTNGK